MSLNVFLIDLLPFAGVMCLFPRGVLRDGEFGDFGAGVFFCLGERGRRGRPSTSQGLGKCPGACPPVTVVRVV